MRLSPLGALVRWLARFLPEHEREDIGMEIAEQTQALRTAPETTGAGQALDWSYVWAVLIDASVHAHRITALLADQRAYFDFHDLLDDAKALQLRLERAYSLTCTAPRLEGLALEAGVDLATVRRRIDIRRAETVAAELAPLQRPPAPGAPTWSIDYRSHGGFIATSEPAEGTRPWRFWGMAPTAASAAHTLRWYFLDQPPHITFDPPQSAQQPYVRTTTESDVSTEGPRVHELLEQRGLLYDEHLAACAAARDVLAHCDDIADHLAKRAGELNATDPQLQRPHDLLKSPKGDSNDHGGFAETVQWVPAHLVVSTNHPSWGDFDGHRDRAPFDIVGGLLSSDLEAFTHRLFTDEISLMRAPGWAGPLYGVSANGNHRVHTARMLNLPWLAATVLVEPTPPSWGIPNLLASDNTDEERRRLPRPQRARKRQLLITGFIRRGIIDGDLTGDRDWPILRCRQLPAAWLLRAPQYATHVNAIYERCYPGALAQLGIPLAIGTDPAAWCYRNLSPGMNCFWGSTLVLTKRGTNAKSHFRFDGWGRGCCGCCDIRVAWLGNHDDTARRRGGSMRPH